MSKDIEYKNKFYQVAHTSGLDYKIFYLEGFNPSHSFLQNIDDKNFTATYLFTFNSDRVLIDAKKEDMDSADNPVSYTPTEQEVNELGIVLNIFDPIIYYS